MIQSIALIGPTAGGDDPLDGDLSATPVTPHVENN